MDAQRLAPERFVHERSVPQRLASLLDHRLSGLQHYVTLPASRAGVALLWIPRCSAGAAERSGVELEARRRRVPFTAEHAADAQCEDGVISVSLEVCHRPFSIRQSGSPLMESAALETFPGDLACVYDLDESRIRGNVSPARDSIGGEPWTSSLTKRSLPACAPESCSCSSS